MSTHAHSPRTPHPSRRPVLHPIAAGAEQLAEVLPVRWTGDGQPVIVLDAATRTVLTEWRRMRGHVGVSAGLRTALDALSAVA